MTYKNIKRILDIIFSLFCIIILAPVFVLVAIAIKLESEGPIIFKQERLGLNGRVFKMYKFRSMRVGAEKQGSGQYSYEGDPRVTKVGKIIRATSIDEIPQFINVLKGDMSIIGPRPPLTYHPWSFEEYTEVQRRRFLVRPGITGWAQINGRKELPWKRRIEYDIEYVENLSFNFDIKIFILTIIKVLSMQGNVNVGVTVNKNVKNVGVDNGTKTDVYN